MTDPDDIPTPPTEGGDEASAAPATEPEAVPGTAPEPEAEAPGDGDERPRGRSLRLRRRAAAADDPQATGVIERPPDPDQPTGAIPVPAPTRGGARLRRERRDLMAKREEMLFHLGGLTFELFRAGRLGEAVARHRAGMVAEVDDAVRFIDAQLEEIQRQKAHGGVLPAAGPAEAGACLVCRAPFYADARFCMQCGARFAPPPPELLTPGGTQVIPVPPRATEDAG
ncbi:MAG: hypothetical protein IT200_05700 [Thermoleophilia bacterium]|nr:hypothetical protein [Thermoleophilia bacterium]